MRSTYKGHGTCTFRAVLLEGFLLDSRARVVFVSSTAGQSALAGMGETLRKRFVDSELTLAGLDALMAEFVEAAADGSHKEKGYWPSSAYGTSKLAMTTMARVLAQDGCSAVYACCSGFCRTDMTVNSSWTSPSAWLFWLAGYVVGTRRIAGQTRLRGLWLAATTGTGCSRAPFIARGSWWPRAAFGSTLIYICTCGT